MPTTIQLPPAAPVQPRRPQSRRAVAVAAGAASLFTVVAVGLVVANHAMTQHDQTSFTATGIRELVVDVDAGDLTLVSSPAGRRVVVETSRDWAWSDPGASHTEKDGVLTLTGNCPDLGVGTCRVNYRVTVPVGVDVRVSLSSGDISATGLNLADLDVSTDSGDIAARDINARRLHAESDSGNITASLSGSPDQVTAETSSGNVTLTVPDGAYKVDADTSAGQVHVTVDDDPTAARRLSAHSSSGDVTIDHR